MQRIYHATVIVESTHRCLASQAQPNKAAQSAARVQRRLHLHSHISSSMYITIMLYFPESNTNGEPLSLHGALIIFREIILSM